MEQQPYQISSITSFDELIGHPRRTGGCILLYCVSGRAVVECNFKARPFCRGDMLIVFSDILFTMRRVSRCFEVRYFELSASLTDEATFTSGGAFFDWLTDHPVFMIPVEKRKGCRPVVVDDRLDRGAVRLSNTGI